MSTFPESIAAWTRPRRLPIHAASPSTPPPCSRRLPVHAAAAAAASASAASRYTEGKLIRTYPDNKRVDSSNYSPVPAWNFGGQLVALNYQTSDVPMQLNRGRFRDNGNCGYLLRPPFHQPAAELALGDATADYSKRKALATLHRQARRSVANAERRLRRATEPEATAAAADKKGSSGEEVEEAGNEEKEEEEEVVVEGGAASKQPWAPPVKFKDYVAESPWATEAMSLCVRVLSASHLPKRASGDESSGGDHDEKASVEMEIVGAPCDCRRWGPSVPTAADGVKHIFDECLSTDVAEPRLALLRFAVLRGGNPVAQTVVPVHRMRQGVRW